ncbi:hypothetical protein NC981_19205 [Leptolyngbya sp. DQ-M1]|uniref:hypothetical protein n=1 Tax=Leptolyngbya sp. DQ-M1 TaxID=2933920 RepID=UPI003298EA42
MTAPSRAEIKELIREVFLEMCGGVQPDTSKQWLDLEQAWERLGFPSYHACYKAVQSGLFREGKEVRDRRRPGARRAKWQVNIALANKRLTQDGEKRSSR